MKWYIIINPNAGNGKIMSRISELEHLLGEYEVSYHLSYTAYKFHAKTLCIKAVKNGYRNIMAIGGDGTINEVINGIMSQSIVESKDILFHCLPNGTGNDWQKHHQLTSNWEESIQKLKNPKSKYQDIGLATYYHEGEQVTRYFNNVAGMAYDAFVVKSMEAKSMGSNSILYLINVLLYLFSYKLIHTEIRFNDKLIKCPVYTVNVGICKYSGGGMSLVPHAVSEDGLLALTIARKLSKLDVLVNTYRFYNETLLSHSKVDGYQCESVQVRSLDGQDLLLELDGEYVGQGPVKIDIIKNALQFIS